MTQRFKLPLRVASLDAVPEGFRDRYEADGDEYVLAKEIEVEDVSGLKKALQAERDLRDKAEKRAKQFADIDLDEVTALRTEKAERERADAERKGEYQKLLKQQQDKFDAQIREAQQKAQQLEQRLHDRIRRQAVTEALAKANGNVALLTPHVAGTVKVVFDEDGNEIVQVVDQKGNPRIGKSGDAMTLDELIGGMKEDQTFAAAFAGTGNSGGGPRDNSGGNGSSAASGLRRKVPNDMNIYDASQFRRLQETADKEGVTYVDQSGAIVVAPMN